jgi:site-specific DNA-methyltransferase (adenine-specific)
MEYMKTIADGFFDLAIVDPPYGINVTRMSMGTGGGIMKRDSTVKRLRDARLKESGKLKNQISCDWDFYPPTAAYFKELFRVSKSQIIWGGNYFDLPPTRCIVCWDKEQVFENFSQVEMAWTSFNMPAKLFRYSNGGFRCGDKSPKIHPTQKPVKLYHYLLDTFAKPGDRIFDSHLGSGSSRIAAYRLGFDFHATEIDKIFFDAQEKRFRQECFGEFVLPNGKKSVQYSLFTD